MEETATAPADLRAMLQAAADFASYPGMHSDATVRQFLEQFPLPKLLGALQSEADTPDVVETIAACLDKVFISRYGASLLPSYGAFMQAGLIANSQTIRHLACKAVYHLIKNAGDSGAAADILVQHNIYPLLINCLIEGNEQISAVAMEAIRCLAENPKGIDIIFPAAGQGVQLDKLAAQSSSMARIRILALIAKLFNISSSLATTVHDSGLLKLFENEINDRSDMLKTLSALELLYELAESSYSSSFLLKTSLLQLIIDLINDSSADSLIRSRAALISGRLLSSVDDFTTIGESYITSLLLAIDKSLKISESQNTDEFESGLETLGLIGSTTQGASLLLTSSSNIVRHVVQSSFDRQGRGKQLAALHAFGSICGVDRGEDKMILDDKAEECLKSLVYTTAANSPKLAPSALLLSVLQQEPDIRVAGYRVISGLVVRQWCLIQVFSKPEIITIITDPSMEQAKQGMEARYDCCVAITRALSTSYLLHEATIAELIGKLHEAVERGPYRSDKKRAEAQPVVVAEERF